MSKRDREPAVQSDPQCEQPDKGTGGKKDKGKKEPNIILSKKLALYREIKADENRRAEYKRFAVHSVFESIIAVLFSLFIFAATNLSLSNPLLFILLSIVLYTLATAVPLIALGYAFVNMLFQLKLNKQFAAWTALMFFLAAIIGVTLIILGGFGQLG